MFQIISEVDSQKEIERMTSKKFDEENGPLWRVTLQYETDKSKIIPELEEDNYSHQHSLFFAIHHSITDGYSTTRICGWLLSILNDVISGTA